MRIMEMNIDVDADVDVYADCRWDGRLMATKKDGDDRSHRYSYRQIFPLRFVGPAYPQQ